MPPDPPATLYRYGPLAWLWRVLGALGLGAGAFCLVAAVRSGAPELAAVALPLALPVVALFPLVATSIALEPARDGAQPTLRVATLAGWRRRIPVARLAGMRRRSTAYSEGAAVHAPRAWILVRGGLPVYVDLLARIPDPRRFAAVLDARRVADER